MAPKIYQHPDTGEWITAGRAKSMLTRLAKTLDAKNETAAAAYARDRWALAAARPAAWRELAALAAD